MKIPPLLAPLTLALLLSACATGPQTPPALQIDSSYTSDNQDSRAQFLILHYTVLDFPKSLKVLTSGGLVSSHYLVRDEPPTIYRLVDENRRAWHAGPSFWAGHSNLNAASIGIEIVNTGYTDTAAGRVYAPFSQKQIDAVLALSKDIVARHGIKPERILGHADIAPGRKQDPGPMFPWKQFADAGLIPWPDAAQVAAKVPLFTLQPPDYAWAQERLARIGYNVPRHGQLDQLTQETIVTFQMKYRPSRYDGQLDPETAALIDVASSPGGMLLKSSSPLSGEAKPYTSRW
jgi:N-acetylmuramoyl-L-alanine amidase